MFFKDNHIHAVGMKLMKLLGFIALVMAFAACGQQAKNTPGEVAMHEDREAKRMLQGIWLNADDGTVVFRVGGDTISYPDSISMPVAFQIYGDTLVLHGVSDVRYAIVRQTVNVFEFKNQNNETVKLLKSDDEADAYSFHTEKVRVINQNRLIKRDTVLMVNGLRYHCYVQVNPTTYRVIKTTYNNEGVSVDNVYYDNIINLGLFQGTRRVFSNNFRKSDFAQYIEEKQLSQCILSDMLFNRVENDGVHYDAVIGIPDSPSAYIVDVKVSFDGQLLLRR